ncbi:AraC family transcriptional regulator [Brachybacterium sp. YJGR34]|uniref:AraC family transcriptional regulator n=1 Tax=Brachybacterium sp. YJGR34 TaxID=2059911 RepID=UPI000E0B6F19|nr:AraC family transcriptional regulator [Brachybacterium sp. YJGR34]
MSLDLVAEASGFVDLAGQLTAGEVDGFAVDYLSWGFYEPSRWHNTPHTHSFHEVCLAYAGAGTFTLEGTTHRVEAGTLFLARPGDVHQIVADDAGSDGLGIAFWGFTLRETPAARTLRHGWWNGLTRADHPVVSDALGALPTLVTALAAEASSPRSGRGAQLEALGTALVIETARAFATPEDLRIAVDPASRTTSIVALMQRYLADNLQRPLEVRDVAEAAHLSTRHAARLFAQETGTSVMSALRRLRLERGAHLLLETEEPVTQVARQCGYPEVRPFITAFGRRYGQTPGSFRAHGGTLHL